MAFDPALYKHQETTAAIIRCFFDVYNELGAGFLESVYGEALEMVLLQCGLKAKRQFPLPVFFRGRKIGDFRADLIVDDAVIVEIKAAKALDPAHEAQLLNYLRAHDFEVGLLLNFGPSPSVKRLVFSNHQKKNLRSSA
jgi:GxxExxY protein